MTIDYDIERWKSKQDGTLLTQDEINAIEEEHGYEYVEENYEYLCIELEVEFTGQWEDDGIGAYEYWGFPGVDVDWNYVVEDFDSAIDPDGVDWKDRLTSEEEDDILRKCKEYGAEQTEDDDFDPEDYERNYEPSWYRE